MRTNVYIEEVADRKYVGTTQCMLVSGWGESPMLSDNAQAPTEYHVNWCIAWCTVGQDHTC